MTSFTLIAAVAKNGIIGSKNKLPWNYSEDLKRFKALTTGKIVIMGRNTFESIGKPLPGRKNFVVSSTMKPVEGLFIFKTFMEAIEASKAYVSLLDWPKEIMIIGGEKIYQQAMPLANKLLITFIHENHEGDAYFPEINEAVWKRTSTEPKQAFSYVTFERK